MGVFQRNEIKSSYLHDVKDVENEPVVITSILDCQQL